MTDSTRGEKKGVPLPYVCKIAYSTRAQRC